MKYESIFSDILHSLLLFAISSKGRQVSSVKWGVLCTLNSNLRKTIKKKLFLVSGDRKRDAKTTKYKQYGVSLSQSYSCRLWTRMDGGSAGGGDWWSCCLQRYDRLAASWWSGNAQLAVTGLRSAMSADAAVCSRASVDAQYVGSIMGQGRGQGAGGRGGIFSRRCDREKDWRTKQPLHCGCQLFDRPSRGSMIPVCSKYFLVPPTSTAACLTMFSPVLSNFQAASSGPPVKRLRVCQKDQEVLPPVSC